MLPTSVMLNLIQHPSETLPECGLLSSGGILNQVQDDRMWLKFKIKLSCQCHIFIGVLLGWSGANGELCGFGG